MRNHVDFVFIGPDKSGSTWLDSLLRQHPDASLPRSKDLFFFDRYHYRGLDWYDQQFRTDREPGLRIEVGHDYLFSPAALQRIRSSAPDARVGVVLREPIERAYSAYRHMVYQGRVPTSMDFSSALIEVDELLDHGMYGRHLTNAIGVLGRDKIAVWMFDDLRAGPRSFWEDVCQRLGLNPVELTGEAMEAANRARIPRSAVLNRLLRALSWRLRDAGFGPTVSRLKSSRLVEYASTGTGVPAASGTELDTARLRMADRVREDTRIADELFPDLAICSRWGY